MSITRYSILWGILCWLTIVTIAQETPVPPEQPSPFISGDVEIVTDDLFLYDTFDNPDTWEQYTDDSTRAITENGVYRIQRENSTQGIWGQNEALHADVVIQVETTQRSSDNDNGYGVMCRASADNTGDGYLFRITGNGFYAIAKVEKGEARNLVDWTFSQRLSQGQATNTLTAICVGDYIAFYANGGLLAETRDATFRIGVTALFARSADDNPVDVSFDNLAIWSADSADLLVEFDESLFNDDTAPDPTRIANRLQQGSQSISLLNALIETDFSAEDVRLWDIIDTDTQFSAINDEQFIIGGLSEAGTHFYSRRRGNYTDTVLDVTTRQFSSERNNGYGVMCRVQQADTALTGYMFRISGDGYYYVGRITDDGFVPLTDDWQASDVIFQQRSSNQLTAVCVDDYLALLF